MSNAGETFEVAAPMVGPAWLNRLANAFRRNALRVLVLGALFQFIVLGSMIVMHSLPLFMGQRILVRATSPYYNYTWQGAASGQSIVLQYPFSKSPPNGIDGEPLPPYWRRRWDSDDQWLADRPVYVSLILDTDNRHYVPGGFSFREPSQGLYLKGRYVPAWGGDNLRFGIETFFVPENKTPPPMGTGTPTALDAEIAVAPWGQAVLVDVH